MKTETDHINTANVCLLKYLHWISLKKQWYFYSVVPFDFAVIYINWNLKSRRQRAVKWYIREIQFSLSDMFIWKSLLFIFVLSSFKAHLFVILQHMAAQQNAICTPLMVRNKNYYLCWRAEDELRRLAAWGMKLCSLVVRQQILL